MARITKAREIRKGDYVETADMPKARKVMAVKPVWNGSGANSSMASIKVTFSDMRVRDLKPSEFVAIS